MGRLTQHANASEAVEIVTLRDHGLTWRQIASRLKKSRTIDSIRSIYKRAKRDYRASNLRVETADEAVSKIIHTQKKHPDTLTSDEWLDVFDEAGAVRERVSINELSTTKKIKTDKPIAVCFTSDWHLGSAATDYEALRADLKIIETDPRIFGCVGGDACDNFMPSFKDAEAAVHQLQPPQYQRLAFEAMLTPIKHKVIAVVTGNHDLFDTKQTGTDVLYYIFRDMPFSVLPHGGLVTLTVGAIEYKIVWKHQYRYNSSINLFNAHHRLVDQLLPTADIAVLEHEHNPGIESLEKFEFSDRRTVVNIRTGTYKGADSYSMKRYKAGRPGPQTVILWPDRKKILALHGADALRDAQVYLDGYYQKA
jgi:transcriptional regulator